LFFWVKTITTLNLGEGETFEIEIKKTTTKKQKTKKNSRRCTRSPDNAKFGHFTLHVNRVFKKGTTATATGTSLNKRFNEQNNGCARALQFLVHFFVVLSKTTT